MSTINYTKPIEDLIAGLNETGHVSHITETKTSVTLHHNGGVANTHEDVLNTWKTREASAHFDVDVHGNIAQYVAVNEVAWGVGNWPGNLSTISIEMADAVGSPSWEISDATLNEATSLAAWLFANVIKTRPAASNFFPHQHWTQTDCPGPYVMKHWSTILATVQSKYDALTSVKPHLPVPMTIVQVAHQVIQGMWGNGQDRVNRLTAAGYDAKAVQAEVNLELLGKSLTPTKTISQLATEVINGEWGNDPLRTQKLTAAGYDAHQVQLEVNRRLLA